MHTAGSSIHYQSEQEEENPRKEVRWIFSMPFMSFLFDLEAFTVGSVGWLQQDPDVRICSINFWTVKISCDLSRIDEDIVIGNYRMNQKSTSTCNGDNYTLA